LPSFPKGGPHGPPFLASLRDGFTHPWHSFAILGLLKRHSASDPKAAVADGLSDAPDAGKATAVAESTPASPAGSTIERCHEDLAAA
jgi:hypothetical protein